MNDINVTRLFSFTNVTFLHFCTRTLCRCKVEEATRVGGLSQRFLIKSKKLNEQHSERTNLNSVRSQGMENKRHGGKQCDG